jgi:hypothetical protein
MAGQINLIWGKKQQALSISVPEIKQPYKKIKVGQLMNEVHVRVSFIKVMLVVLRSM